MVLIVLLVLALFVLQTLLPACFRYMRGGDFGNKIAFVLGPRDDPPPQSKLGARAERALANMLEALPVFLALALLNLIVGTAAHLAITGATVFLVARALYVPAYLAGIPGLRTFMWVISWVGLAMMLVPLLQKGP
jgi:uncharacterized MAPEG superfamily protein